jgi:Cytochrome P450
MHDPKVFEDPMEFKPERYLKDGKLNTDLLDPMDVAFGYGRRFVMPCLEDDITLTWSNWLGFVQVFT